MTCDKEINNLSEIPVKSIAELPFLCRPFVYRDGKGQMEERLRSDVSDNWKIIMLRHRCGGGFSRKHFKFKLFYINKNLI